MSVRLVSCVSAVLLLSACGGISRHCEGEFEYQQATTLPPPGDVEGLHMPESPSALRIPPAPENPVPFARKVSNPEKVGETRTECLDIPPRIKVEPPPPEPEAPKS